MASTRGLKPVCILLCKARILWHNSASSAKVRATNPLQNSSSFHPIHIIHEMSERSMLVFEIIPPAIGIAISPLPIMIVVLLLVAGNSKSAIYYVLGWIAGIVAVGVGLVLLADRLVSHRDPQVSGAIAWATVLLGLFFLFLGYLSWRSVKARRLKQSAKQLDPVAVAAADPASVAEIQPAEVLESALTETEISQEGLPGWMRAIDKVKPLLAVAVALVSAFNPKNFSMILLAITDIHEANVGPLRGTLAYLNFALLASITVAIPVLYWAYDRKGSEVRLKEWQRWLADHQQEIMMWLFGVLGTLTLIKGIQKFF
jgi:hypothetical protein